MIRDAATQHQIDAANPRQSTWLSANAGSGKTRVLTDRVARLLLEDVSPQNILCLTYTKAAATEMQNRLFKRLGAWAMMPDAKLRAALADLGVARAIDADQLRQARTLFARAIETPGGLKIQTIHSFCAGLLRRFPLEAQVSPQFREMEDREAELLRADVVDGMLLGTDAQVVEGVLAHFTGNDLAQLTKEIAQHRQAFQGAWDKAAIHTVLGLAKDATRADALALAFAGDEASIADSVAEVFKSESKTYRDFATKLGKLHFADPGWNDLETLFSLFLYAKDGTSKSVNFPQSNHSNAVAAMAPIAAEVHDWMDRVAAARQHLLTIDAADRTAALYAFAIRFIPAYEARKLAMGALDFDDLIRKAKDLLTNPDLAQWVLFRLDGGIDHVLVDEAQDTSPTQWAVIERLTQEFAAGEGANAQRERTVFVVGDKKQSIYSFQGADPDEFDRMSAHFTKAQEAVGQTLEPLTLAHSFRSAQPILDVVDTCFTGDRAAGMDDSVSHIAFKADMPGRVDLWPVIEQSKDEDDRLWYDPVDQPSARNHDVILARQIADQIKWMIENETIPVEKEQTGTYERRPITEGDILILVRSRSDLFAEIIRACKAADLKIAGADRLRVGAELAVKDLAALLNFLALPEDDLSLAAALRSPLFGWREQDLYSLAHHRPDKAYLWSALRDSGHAETLAIIHDLRERADFLRPYDLLERILIRHGGRQKLLARLGPEAEDGIDALLSQALAYEQSSVPSLTGFLTWMQTDDVEVKRQMESKGDRIRVMTVHGAKGLEAPIVILPDTVKRKREVNDEILPAGDHIIWKPRADDSPEAVKTLKDDILAKQDRERMRLLYVAMTRAEKWLIVAAAGDVGDGDDSWYNIVSDGMAQRGATDATSGALSIKRVASGDWDGLPLGKVTQTTRPEVTLPRFSDLPQPGRASTISPSDLDGAKVLPGESGEGDTEAAKARGTLIHRLLEHLPLAPPDARQTLGLQIAGQGDAGTVGAVIRLLDDPALAHIWAADALTEVDITAEIAGLGRIHGAIDRLIITDQQITAIDYKSNRLVPDRPEATPDGLLRQMAVYHAALAQIFPETPVSVAILWTETATLMPIPDDLLHEAMMRLATS
ncbi:double-strand break repair helicase AddA [Yoonia sp.]|uniref:double-strand break repair helicase AddA n=1 Tax=Yoonia sp. TaxID=2212373 RepID=UPI002FD8B7FB